MHEKNLNLQASRLAGGTGTVVRTLMTGAGYNFMRLTMIRSAMAGAMSGGAICEAVDYLADGGYIEIRTAAEKRPARVADVPMESLELKLTPKGTQLALGMLDDPLVDI